MDDAIGVFDSGVGGLTVVSALMDAMPGERVVYLGDTARVPYGTKSPDTVIRYARACTKHLLHRGVKLIVVACNTASAHALSVLQDETDAPVLGVIEPGARAAAEATANGKIGVVGTEGTIASGEYESRIRACRDDVSVFCAPCPLFVPLAEEGWIDGSVPEEAARRYLSPLLEADIDILLLGCTHYPLLAKTIAAVAGPSVRLVDSARSTAAAVESVIDAMSARADEGGSAPGHTFLVSDAPERFADLGSRFLGRPIETVEWIDF